MAELNPYCQVYNALWDLLEAHDGFTNLVRLKNRIKFTDTHGDPMKEEVSSKDLPEIRLIPISTDPHLQRTSNSTSVVKRYQFQMSTGTKNVDLLFAVEWEILRAMVDWLEVLMALTWEGKPFVKLVGQATATEGILNQDLNRGIIGWSAIWECEITMWFTTSDLKP